MTDIVARLRAMENDMVGPYRILTLKAAAEIGRLRNLAQIVREQGFELERLRARIERWEAQSIAQYAEIKRLRAALQRIEHETGMTMLATNHGRRGDIANAIARRALEPKP